MEKMERGATIMRKKAYYSHKIKLATQLLFYKHHMKPGVKGWELKNKLGSNYPRILEVLDNYLKKLGLQVKTVFEEKEPEEKPTFAELNKARFFVTLRGDSMSDDQKMMGWRIDDVAGLAATISFIISKNGKASREDVVDLLRIKLPAWKVDINMNRYLKAGYLSEDENGILYLDWRTRAEIDQQELVKLILRSEI